MKVLTVISLAALIVGYDCDGGDSGGGGVGSGEGKLQRIVVHEAKISYINKRDETARNFLHDFKTQNPVVFLVDDTDQTNRDAMKFIRNVFRLTPNPPNFILMKFNGTGVTDVLETTQNNMENFLNKLMEIDMTPSNYLDFKNTSQKTNKTAAFFAILNAIQILPKNSGILLFINRKAVDEDLAEYALKDIKKKQIHLFVVWGHSSTDDNGNGSDSRILQEIAYYSHGKFYINSDRDLSAEYYSQFMENANYYSNMSMISTRRNIQGFQYIEFPIDSNVNGIHISISPNITHGELTTPKGHKIDLLEAEEVAQYTKGSFIVKNHGTHEIHLNTTTATVQDVGIWRLLVNNAHEKYNVTVFVYTELVTNAILLGNSSDANKTENVIGLSVSGEVREIKSVSFVDENGNIINYWQQDLAAYQNEDLINNNNTNSVRLLLKTPEHPQYVLVNGTDNKGHNFSRLSYVRQQNGGLGTVFQLRPLTIDVGSSSELITQPNRRAQIFFEVTNNGNTAVFVRFTCTDERSILLSMNPWSTTINPQQTATVQLTLSPRPGSYQDTITFTAIGSENVEKKVIVDVGTSTALQADNTDPTVNYKYTSDCTNVLTGSCTDGTWTVEVRARDTGSGLLQVTSQPKGLYFPYGFTTGTNEEVTGYYSDSCCNPDLQIIAIDRQNNRRILNVNSYRATLSAGSISAIVLGVIILILIILLIVYVIRKVCCKKDSYDLPVYKGRRTKY